MTTPYSELTTDQLRSAIVQRDEQLRVALVEVEKWKESVTAVALASQEVEDSLKTMLKECVELLNLARWSEWNAERNAHAEICNVSWDIIRGTINRATALLENTEPPQLSPVGSKREPDQPATVGFLTTGDLLPGLREAWRILNVAPEESIDFKVGRIMERIKELEK